MRRLPPLNHLKAFEAAGRLGSFKAAAADLSVSEAAVSQHIRALESYLGAPLFIRTHSGVLLTPAGERYVEQLTQAFDCIDAASSEFRQTEMKGVLKVSVVPSLGNRWLLPRLERFAKAHPEIQIEPILTPQLTHLGSEADIAIRHGNGVWGDAEASLLKSEMLIPVASDLFLSEHETSSAQMLMQCSLLTAMPRRREWPHWFVAQGEQPPATLKYVVYDTVALAIDAAIAGVGVCLIDKSLIQDDLKQGRLKVVSDKPVPGINSYYVLLAKGATPDPRALLFKEWLIAEAKRG